MKTFKITFNGERAEEFGNDFQNWLSNTFTADSYTVSEVSGLTGDCGTASIDKAA